MAQQSSPVALTVAGSDCSAGAGLQADLKTFSALGVFGVTAVTCVVAEVPGRVLRIEAVDAQNVRDQIELLLAHFPIAAIKTGLLFSPEIVETVATVLEQSAQGIPVIVDPVMIATSGDALLQPAAIEGYCSRLFPRATLVTPNMAEAAALTGRRVSNLEEMRVAGNELAQKFGTRFLLKGGHLGGAQATDLLFGGTAVAEFSAPFVQGVSTHGTGCTYSAAIAARLALGDSLPEAIARAKEFVSRAIRDHFSWTNSSGEVHALNHERQT
ncbi:MAG TPA: bifunctional hydroxymethylpyrimidine kinase/phosphomethylpyrimidine kinase [Chthoniobacterales bacterium]|jgi:hydroxymethylpyrimidine/phosphomethylpyrimidine kinase|nr:bifunctional hydroxymethylpyrimidine kinase/phosphomethylpyrimidine kinase [Chthoniobacterales bacterium]